MSKDLKKPPEQPLSVREERRLAALEKVIVDDFAAFVRVGQALAEINETRLYRITPDGEERTFEQYCRSVHDLARASAYRYITAAQTFDNVSNWRHPEHGDDVIEMVPANEAQVRPLTKLRPEQQAIVWQQAVKSSPNGRPTAAHVKRTVDQYLGAQVAGKVEKVKREQRLKQVKMSPFFVAAYDALLEVINREALEGWVDTDKDAAHEYIMSLAATLEA